MIMDNLLDIQPRHLNFPIQLGKQVSCSIRLSNKTQKHVAFKVFATLAEKFSVLPKLGLVLPGSSCDLKVTMIGPKEAPPSMQCNDKFLIKSVVASPSTTTEVAIEKLFDSSIGDLIQKLVLEIIYTCPAQIPSPVAERSASARKLLDVQPPELQFPYELKKQLSCSLRLSNMTDNHVGFKVKTTNLKKYCVRPNTGKLLPRSTCDVVVTMQAQKEIPLDRQCKDKFLIQSIVASPAAVTGDITQAMFNDTNHVVQEHKLGVVYTPSHPPLSYYSPRSQPESSPGSSTMPGRTSNNAEASARKLLDVQPPELQFPYELKKQLSCSLRLSNMTDNHVGFKLTPTAPVSVKTTHLKKYCVRPNTGKLLPRSTCDVVVTMQAQKEIPLDRQCKDKFLIQSIVASPAAVTGDITQAMFNDTKHVVQQHKLGVVYTPSHHPLSYYSPRSQPESSPGSSTMPGRTSNNAEERAPKLLDVQTSELQFPFEMKKQLSCSLRLSNMTDNHVGFKVKTTHPKKYCVKPNMGKLLPRSTCDVVVTMQAHKEIPLDRQCKDKFLIQSIAITGDITPEMFDVAEHGGQDLKLGVVYSLPHHSESAILQNHNNA